MNVGKSFQNELWARYVATKLSERRPPIAATSGIVNEASATIIMHWRRIHLNHNGLDRFDEYSPE